MFKRNIISFSALFLALIIVVFVYFNNQKTKQELTLLRNELTNEIRDNYETVYNDLDSKIDKWDGRIVKLKEEGYVEIDEFSDISKKITTSTVLIVSDKEKVQLSESGNEFIFNDDSSEKKAGTGFFINKEGYVATAKHVVDSIGEDTIVVKTFSGKSLRAELVSVDESSDMAILKTDIGNSSFVNLGYYPNLEVGDEIGFIGFFSNGTTVIPLVHRGVISAKGIEKNDAKIFTINAFVNKGNSGGPVFSIKTGRVIGVLSARQRDVSSDKFISLPSNYTSGLNLSGIDPLKFNVDLYNKTLKVVGDVSQVGVGIVYSTDIIRDLLSSLR